MNQPHDNANAGQERTSLPESILIGMECPQVRIFPVNPLALSNYRKAFAPGGGKNDPVDAHLLMQFLQHYREQLRELKVNSPQTRELATPPCRILSA